MAGKNDRDLIRKAILEALADQEFIENKIVKMGTSRTKFTQRHEIEGEEKFGISRRNLLEILCTEYIGDGKFGQFTRRFVDDELQKIHRVGLVIKESGNSSTGSTDIRNGIYFISKKGKAYIDGTLESIETEPDEFQEIISLVQQKIQSIGINTKMIFAKKLLEVMGLEAAAIREARQLPEGVPTREENKERK